MSGIDSSGPFARLPYEGRSMQEMQEWLLCVVHIARLRQLQMAQRLPCIGTFIERIISLLAAASRSLTSSVGKSAIRDYLITPTLLSESKCHDSCSALHLTIHCDRGNLCQGVRRGLQYAYRPCTCVIVLELMSVHSPSGLHQALPCCHISVAARVSLGKFSSCLLRHPITATCEAASSRNLLARPAIVRLAEHKSPR